MRKAKGITMVALAITVVVLIFLAFIVIRIAVGDNGIFTLTKSEGDNFKVDQFKDKVYAEMSALVLKLTMDDEALTSETIVGRFESLKWIGSASIISDEEVQVVSTDHIAVNIIFDPFGGYNLLGQGISNDEPYPTLELEQLPLKGEVGEKIKIRVTADVKTTKETTGVETIKNVSTGESKEYSSDGVIFEVSSNGEYTFKAISNTGKAKLAKIRINVISAGVVNVVIDPSTPRNTEKTETLNGIATGPINVKMTFGEIDAKNSDRFQYRVGENGTWEIVNGDEVQIQVTQNIDIFTRFYDGTNYVAGESYSVQNVDNVPPSDLQAEVVSATSNSLTVEATATDTASVGAGFDVAKVARFEYSIDNVNWQSSNTLENLAHGRTYVVYVKVIDGAGNQTVTSINGKTETIPGEIGIAAETTTWTQGPIEIEVVWPENAENYNKEYKIGDGDWLTYSVPFSVSENGKIYARLADATQGGAETEYEIDWIDKVLPEAPTLEATGDLVNGEWYVGDISVAITDGIDSFGEVSHSQYSINGSQSTTADNNVFTINQDGAHTITAYTFDKAGNRSATYGELFVKRDSTGPRFEGLEDIEVTAYDESTFMQGIKVTDNVSEVDGDVTYTPTTLELGDNTITYTATDKAGNTTTVTRIITYKDGIAPDMPTFKTEGTEGNDNWFTSDVTVTIVDGTDSFGTVDYTAYTIEGAQEVTEETKGNTIVITEDGESKITAYTYDTAGNQSLAGKITIKKDSSKPNAPTLQATTTPEGNDNWYKSEVTVTITDGTDSYGTVDYTEYTITGAQEEVEAVKGNSVTITEDGESTITAYTYDTVGNKSEAGILTIKKDTEAPTFSGLTETTITSASYDLTEGVTATDDASGIEGTFTYSPETLEFGDNTITYTATDKAGNTTTETRKVTYKDETPPGAPSLAASGTTGTNNWYKSEVIVTITNGTDSFGSGEGIYSEYTVTGAEEIATTKGNEIVITAEGTSVITAYTYDGATNKSDKAELEINIDTTGPEFTGLTDLTIESYDDTTFKNGVAVSDTTSGVTSETDFSYDISNLQEGDNEITYTATDKAGNTTTETRKVTYNPIPTLVSQVTAANYGDTVTYSANGITDWKIFYNDETYIYIIASDYVANSKVETSNLGMTTDGSYDVYWSSFPDTSLSVGTWQLSGNGTFEKSQDNYYATAGLMNTSKWSSFVNSTYADQAIGGPTLDMYIASWNEKYTSNKLYLAANSTGYYVGTSSNPTSTNVQMSETSGYSDTLYYPYTADGNNCSGYWLASPSALDTYLMLRVSYDGYMDEGNCFHSGVGVRPVVRLKSTVGGTLSGTNWTLQ